MTSTFYKLSIKCAKLFVIITLIVSIGTAWGYAYEIGVQLLSDPGFEESIPNGTFPTSGAWAPSWLYEAGQICTTTASHSGSVGLYIYTGSGGTSWRSDPYQAVDKTAEAGDVFTGEVWASTLSSLVPGSQMLVRLTFLNSSQSAIVSKDSTPLTTASSGWTKLTVVTDPAPPGTAYIRYRLYLAKPSGVTGQSIGNFDDCYLELTSQTPPVPQLNIYPQALGLTKTQTQAQFTIKNIGNGSLNWNLTESESWITGASPTSGTTAAGAATIVTVTINRVGLSGNSYKGAINVTSDGGNETVTVYMDMVNGYNVPTASSLVTTDGYRVLIQKRLPNGLLDTIKPYVIKGVAWSPSSLGSNGDINARRSDFPNWFVTDIQLIKEMNANTVYTFLDFGTGAQAADILNNLYKNGIMAIITVDEDGNNNTSKITEIVNAYKNHPAILMWAIGNEWNINYYHDKFGSHLTPTTAKLQASADATELAAQQIKGLDSMHPVASIHGEIDIDNRQPLTPIPGYLSTQEIVNDVCPSVDVWGVNIYRGDNFGTLFSQWASIADKPLFLSEFGTDSYYTTAWYNPVVGYESETEQSIWLDSLWADIEPEISAYDVDRVCLGGTVFEWSDEWWKIPAPDGSPLEHDNEGFDTPWNPYAHPDGFANEEYFGIVQISRKTKQAYSSIHAHFVNVSNFAPIAIPSDVTTEQDTPLLITLNGTDVEGGILTFEIVDNPANGNPTPVSGSTVTYTSFAGYTGEDSFTFRCFDGAKYSTSAAVSITVVPLPSITVLSPNGGENWSVGSTQTITWTSSGSVGNVKIEYSTNNGSSWSTITSSTSNTGSYFWTIPNAPSTQCKVRVSETDGGPSDTSDSTFSIGPATTLLWTRDGSAHLWKFNANGSWAGATGFGYASGWTATCYQRNSDGSAQLLWTRDGSAHLWKFNSNGSWAGAIGYGYALGWTATCYQRNSDGSAQLLWTRDGSAHLWKFNASGGWAGATGYGYAPGWLATCYQRNSDGSAQLLWTRDGSAHLWKFNASGGWVGATGYGYAPGWTATCYQRNSDGSAQLLWTRDGSAHLWKFNSSGGWAGATGFGYADWTATCYHNSTANLTAALQISSIMLDYSADLNKTSYLSRISSSDSLLETPDIIMNYTDIPGAFPGEIVQNPGDTVVEVNFAQQSQKTDFEMYKPEVPYIVIRKGGTGGGTITANGLRCGKKCEELIIPYDKNAMKTLRVVPDAGSYFGGWKTSEGVPLEDIRDAPPGEVFIAVFDIK
jgi:hypothetical protein